jgi:hypothetical protein
MLKIRTMLIAATLMSGATVAAADPAARGAMHDDACGPAKRYEKLARFDGNKDGKLDATERGALVRAREARRAQKVAAHDKNKDGKLDRTERIEAHRAERVARFQALDTNRDAALSKAEAAAACGGIGRHFDRVDLDRNGSVSGAEFDKAAAMRGKGKRFHRARGAGHEGRPVR